MKNKEHPENHMHKTYQFEQLDEAQTTLNAILDIIVEGVWDWSRDTGKVIRSPGWYRMLGYDVDALKATVFTWENIIHADDYAQVIEHFELYTTGQISEYNIEYRCKTANNSYIWICDRAQIVAYQKDGSVARMIGAHQNIDQQKNAQLKLMQHNELLQTDQLNLEFVIQEKTQELAYKNKLLETKFSEIEYICNTDLLTSIANRKKFEEVLSKEISRANRYQHPLSMVLFDIDLFKEINDTQGHKVGDELLSCICHLISDNIREEDLLARWGGDEFVIIFPDLALSDAYQACEKLKRLISAETFINYIKVTCSFGVAQYEAGQTEDMFFQQADKLLYLAKKRGRDRVEGL